MKLKGPSHRLPTDQWIVRPDAYQPIISRKIFDEVQTKLHGRTHYKSNEAILDSLRSLLKKEGKLSIRIIEQSKTVPSFSTLCARFGPLRNVYRLLGYEPRRDYYMRIVDVRRRTQAMRENLVLQILKRFPRVKVVCCNRVRRPVLRFPSGVIVSVLMCPAYTTTYGKRCWRVWPIHAERSMILAVCRINVSHTAIKDIHLMPGAVDRPVSFRLFEKDQWLRQGKRIRNLDTFCDDAESLRCLQL